jgi:uncharacterized protein involved in type VI secretion and phage assembly
MAQSQKDHRTKIKTVIDNNPDFKKKSDEDPLCLVMVQGSEAVSAPYYMDVVMIADRGVEIDPKLMINTPATVFIRVEDRAGIENQTTFTYEQRKGVFQSFIKQDRFHRLIGHDYNMYAGRIVPGFQIMDQEVRYRIFEKSEMTFLSVLDACTASFKPLQLASGYMDTSRLSANDLPKMEHCVQYGESTFNFLSRLMSRFSLWYYFDHDGPGDLEKMVIGTGHIAMGSRDPNDRSDKSFPRCKLFRTFPDRRDIVTDLIVQDWQFVNGVSRVYTPAPRRTRTSDFNTVISTQPIQSADNTDTRVTKDFDIIQPSESVVDHLQASTETNYIQESFPDSTIYKDEDATSDAKTALEIYEGQVFALSGVSKNTTFYAGKRFLYEGLREDNRFRTEQLITQMAFNAYDRDYINIITRAAAFGFAALLDDLFVQPATSFAAQFGSNQSPDFATAMAAAGLQETIAAKLEEAWAPANTTAGQDASQSPPTPFGTYFAGGMAGYAAAFLPNATSVLQDLLPLFQGTINVLSKVLETVVTGVLAIPIIFAKLAGHDLAGDIHRVFAGFTDKADRLLKRWLYVPTNDAFSACFVSEPLEKGLIGPPLPTARNAQIFGPHLATVIGSNGIDLSRGNIWADKLGRVRVRFPWDRTPAGAEAALNDPLNASAEWTDAMAKPQYLVGTDTAWLRVADAWAGLFKFGTQFLPRVGDEVIVSFIDSDPDRPIITGRVYNSYNQDANHPFPDQSDETKIENMESLRKLHGSSNWNYSGIKTRSMPLKKEDKDRFHLLRFDDTKDKEQYLIRSQRRLDITALEKRYESISSDRHLTVGGIDPKTHMVGGTYFAKIFKDYNLHVGDPAALPKQSGNRSTKLENDDSLDVSGNVDQLIGGHWTVEVGSNPIAGPSQITLLANGIPGAIVLSGITNITLMTGASAITITPVAISITSPVINLVGTVLGPPPSPMPTPVTLPPAVPMPAVPVLPNDPTPADPGDEPKPPKE